MLKICTVYYNGIYSPDYVSKLYNGLKKHSTIPFEFICLSDTDVEADLVLPYNHSSDIKKHWHKLKFFSPDFAYQKPGDDIIVMDIDQTITNNIDELIGHKVNDNELITYDSWWDKDLKINGGFYKFKSGSLKFVWDRFTENPEYWQMYYYNQGIVHYKYYGEQNYVYQCMIDHNVKVTLTPGKWLYKETNNFREKLDLEKLYCKKFNTEFAVMGDVNKYIKVLHNAGVGKKTNG